MLAERHNQDRKWGEQNHDDFKWLAIHGEEFGEACQAALHDQFGGEAAGTLRAELVQLCATVLQHIQCIDRRNTVPQSAVNVPEKQAEKEGKDERTIDQLLLLLENEALCLKAFEVCDAVTVSSQEFELINSHILHRYHSGWEKTTTTLDPTPRYWYKGVPVEVKE